MKSQYNFRSNLIKEYLQKLDLEKSIKNYYHNKTILITGGVGAIGSNLSIALSSLVGSKGKIVIIDNLSANKKKTLIDFPSLSNILFVKGDLRSTVDVNRVFREKPDIVFHLAAFFANQNSVDYPENSADVDINGMIKLLDLAKFTDVEKFVYASSGSAI